MNDQFEYEFEALSNAPNSPELDGKYLGQISEDFAKVAELLKETSYQIRKRGFSEYPIFAVSKTTLPIGSLLIRQGEMQNQWHYFASFLDDFLSRELITEQSLPFFKENYKSADEFACLFVVDGDFAKFVFIPFPED
ncbi:MAG: hypothetical protein U0Y10_21290 [Spirosomataceae bacterium]